MKRFIVRLAAVLLPFIGIVLGISVFSYRMEWRVLENDLRCLPEIRAVVVGDSRAEVYWDPSVIPWLRNCGQSATPFQITAKKAKMLVELNPHLELVVIDIWPSKLFDSNTPFDPSAPAGVSLLEVTDRHNMPPFGDDFPIRFVNGVLKPALQHVRSPTQIRQSLIAGGFLKNHKFLRENKWAREETYAQHEMYQLRDTPLYMEGVLEDLLSWMKDRNVNVVLTTTPIYHWWWEYYYSKEAQEYFTRRVQEIADKYAVKWYNWMHEYQDEIDYWADGDHLNDVGAKAFSADKKTILEIHLKGPQERDSH